MLTIAIADYQDHDDDFTSAVRHQVDLLNDWWCDPLLGDRRFTVQHAEPLISRRDVEDFLHHSGVREAGRDDVLFVYVAGHGVTATSGRHLLQLPSSDNRRLLATTFPTAEVAAAVLGSQAEHVLFIVNACDSGGVDTELAEMVRDLSHTRRANAVLAVLATADFDQSVRIGAFGVLLERLYERLRTISGITTEHLSLNDFLSEMDGLVRADLTGELRLPKRVWAVNDFLPHHSLPNPGYRPAEAFVGPELQQLALPREEMDYWISRASGAGDTGDGRWYFSGRHDLNRRLAAFLTEGPAHHNSPTMIVTGSAGSGKSAVIARAVTFSDSGFRTDSRYRPALRIAPADTVPAEGCIDAAILARNRTPGQIYNILLRALGRPTPPQTHGSEHVQALREATIEAIGQSEKQITIVIDGLDEADDPYGLITQLIAPLAQSASAPRMVIGVRSSRPVDSARAGSPQLLDVLARATTIAGQPPEQHRTDDEHAGNDIIEYLQALLSGTELANVETVKELFTLLPDRTSFLDARMAGIQLQGADDPAALFADPLWRARLDQGTVGLLRQDLSVSASSRLPADTALALLRASAYSLGSGVPHGEVWPAIAEAIAGRRIPGADQAIETLLGSRLAGYLIRDIEDDRVVYRPLHEHLSEVLRHRPHQLHGPEVYS